MPESQTREWKESWRDEYLKWICGFANAQGGVLEIGRDNQGEIVGVEDPLRLLEEIPNRVLSLLGIVVDVNLQSGRGGEYLEIKVAPYPNPISYKGEYHYRSGSTRQVLRGAALNQFLLRKHGRNWDDAPMPGVGLKDLDRGTLKEFRRLGVAAERLPRRVLEDSDDSLIEALRLREGEHLRRAAVLLFHAEPTHFFAGAFVKIGYFRTDTDLAYQDVIEGDLLTQVERTVDLLRTKYSRAEIAYEGIYRRETPLAPGGALREAVLNAVVHRDYSVSAPIQIRVYDDRVSLWNPGDLPLDWTYDDLVGAHASAPHNPTVANAFFRAGMVEAWGRGIGDIVSTCRAAGTVEPRWRSKSGGLGLDFVSVETGREGAESQPESQPESEPESEAQPESQPESEPESEAQPESQPESEPESEAQPESQPESESESQPESESESLETRVLRQLADGPLSKAELSKGLGQKAVSGQLNQVMRRLVSDQRIAYTIPDKPGSRLQKYRLTDKERSNLGGGALSANVRDTGGVPLNGGGHTLARRIDGKTRAET